MSSTESPCMEIKLEEGEGEEEEKEGGEEHKCLVVEVKMKTHLCSNAQCGYLTKSCQLLILQS